MEQVAKLRHISELNLGEKLEENVKKQIKNCPRTNLTINAGAEEGIGQELGKSLSMLQMAEAGWVILFKDHDSIEEKLEHDNYTCEFAWVKGLERFIEDEVILEPHIESQVKNMFQKGIDQEAIKSKLPEQVLEAYINQIPVNEDGKLTKPILTVYNFLDHKLIQEKAEHIVWEENPHQPDCHDLTMENRKFMELAEKHIKPEIASDIWERFKHDYWHFTTTWSRVQQLEDFSEAKRKKIQYKDRSNHYYHAVDQANFGRTMVNSAEVVLKWLNETSEVEGRRKLTGKIAEAVENDDLEKAKKLSRLKDNLQELQHFYDSETIVVNLKKEKENFIEGKNPFTGKKSYLTTFDQFLQKLEHIDCDVTVNYAETTEELIFQQVSTYQIFTLDAEKPICNLTSLVHSASGGSYAKSKMDSSEKKRKIPTSIAKCFQAQNKKVGIVTYSDYTREEKDGYYYRKSDIPALYFWNFKGKNDLDDRDVVIVAGSPMLSPEAMAIEHLLHFNCFPESMVWNGKSLQIDYERMETGTTIEEFNEESLDVIYTHKVKKDLRDASQRLRGQRSDPHKHLIMLGHCPDLIKKHYPEDKVTETNAIKFIADQIKEVTGSGIPLELPYTPDKQKLPQGIWKQNGKLVKTKKYATNKEAEMIEILKDIGRVRMNVLLDHIEGKKSHTRKVINESEELSKTGSRNRRFVTLQ